MPVDGKYDTMKKKKEGECKVMNETYIMFTWLALVIILLLIEIATVGLTCIWAAGGALAALILNVAGASFIWQAVAFVVVTALLLCFTRPFAVKVLGSKREKTNYESVIDQIVRIEERVDNLSQTGRASIDGMEWTVRSACDEEVFEVGEQVKVVSVEGVKLIVKRESEE